MTSLSIGKHLRRASASSSSLIRQILATPCAYCADGEFGPPSVMEESHGRKIRTVASYRKLSKVPEAWVGNPRLGLHGGLDASSSGAGCNSRLWRTTRSGAGLRAGNSAS